MGIKLSKPTTRTVKNSEKNYGKEITYPAITTVTVTGDDGKAVAAVRAGLNAAADMIEAANGDMFIVQHLRSESAIERAFELSQQSLLAVKAAGFAPVVAAVEAKEVSDL